MNDGVSYGACCFGTAPGQPIHWYLLKEKKPVWGVNERVRELGERGTSVLLQTEWCGRVWVVFFFFLQACDRGEKRLCSARRLRGIRDSPRFPRTPCSRRDDETLVTSKCNPYHPQTHPCPCYPPPFLPSHAVGGSTESLHEWKWLFLVFGAATKCAMCSVACFFDRLQKSSFVVHCISCVLRDKTQKL